MSTPVVPWVKGRVNVGWEEDGGEESPVRGVIPPGESGLVVLVFDGNTVVVEGVGGEVGEDVGVCSG